MSLSTADASPTPASSAAAKKEAQQIDPAEMLWNRGLSAAERQELEPLLTGSIDFMDDERFYAPNARQAIMNAEHGVDRPSTAWYRKLDHERVYRPGQKSDELPLLKPKQEVAIFLKFNYCRFRAESARQKINVRRMNVARCRELLKWSRMAQDFRETISEYNLGLVLAMARRLPAGRVDFPEMISEGNMALLRGIDKFNVSKGFKFSTYACRAILKAFSRSGMKATRYRSFFPVGFEPDLERSNYAAEKAAYDEQGCLEQVRSIFHDNRSGLSELERQVIEKRFSFDDPDAKPMTLKQLGNLVGLTKERVRQIQIHALAKMRDTLEHTYLDGPSIADARDRLDSEGQHELAQELVGSPAA